MSQTAEIAEPAELMPMGMPGHLDGRTIEGRRWQAYRRTLIKACGHDPSPVQRLLADRAASLLVRADGVNQRENHLAYAMLVDTAALLICQISGKPPSRRHRGPGETRGTVIDELIRGGLQ